MRWPTAELALLACLTACGPGRPAVPPRPELPATADALTELATEALEADGRLETPANLYASGVEIVADGRRRSAAPRFAGVEAGGEVVVGSVRVDLVEPVAWASVEYRWLARDQNLIREGRATLLFTRTPGTGAWWVAHAHSSTDH
jgi:hypothetical protein